MHDSLCRSRLPDLPSRWISGHHDLTGMFKQDYYISKLLDRTVVVQGSCKIHRALYDRLTETLEELKRIEAGSGVDPDLLEIIQTITQIVDNLYIK